MSLIRHSNIFPIITFTLLMALGAVADADDARTWSDATGRFKIEAKLVSQKDGKVKLERTDGKSVEIDITKLSEADQKYLKELELNPFKTTDDDGKGAMPAKKEGMSAKKETRSGNGSANPGATQNVDWGGSSEVDISSYGNGWDVSPVVPEELDYVPKAVSLPKRVDFFEKLQGVVIHPKARRVVAGYMWNFGVKNKAPQTRLVLSDLNTGRERGEGVVYAEMAPLALHPDGELLLMKNLKRGSPNLELWRMPNNHISRERTFAPIREGSFGRPEVQYARFLDENSFVLKDSSGLVSIWDLSTLQPVCHFSIDSNCRPALSADGSMLAFYKDERIGLFGTKSHEVIAIQKTPRRLNFTNFAFSPSGERLACTAFDALLVWELETGEIYRDFVLEGIVLNSGVEYSHDNFVLLGKRYLVELESMIKLWDYHGAENVQAIDGTTYFSVSPQNSPGAIMPTLLPHEGAREALNAALNEPDLFVFREGVNVQLDTSQIPGSHQAKVEASLRNKLSELDITVDDSAPVTLKAAVSGPKQKEMTYTRSGSYTVQIYTTTVELIYQGKSIWKKTGTNIPHFVRIQSNQNLGDILSKASKQPAYQFYDNLALPKFVQKPVGDAKLNAAPGGQTIGSSKVVPTTSTRRRPTGRSR
ncbi:SHD1 domain-containing protein [Thalassoglobus polymorphus]|uniref:SLA1 homology domain-containing protein n=1 Tax=Thalassoglobus polymorphus TaxID=2527994 RepID=A0A517QPR9_9PLAN|nr:SHD1 domain-containing protein [Thalassoglobus polymorphus]QDT33612.1 hypothetical protein Mal48_28660 [Thalassoglobus polymorphus]